MLKRQSLGPGDLSCLVKLSVFKVLLQCPDPREREIFPEKTYLVTRPDHLLIKLIIYLCANNRVWSDCK